MNINIILKRVIKVKQTGIVDSIISKCTSVSSAKKICTILIDAFSYVK